MKPFITFSSRRVLVTGHTGFVGKWLCRALQELGAEVAGLSLPGSLPAWSDSRTVSVSHYWGDVRDEEFVADVVTEFKPDYIFHLAAQAIVSQSFLFPEDTFSINVHGTRNVLAAALAANSPATVVNMTSDKVYDQEVGPLLKSESSALGGSSPYAHSKVEADTLSDQFRARGLLVGSVRCGNIIGGGDFALDRLLPDIVRAAYGVRPLSIRNPKHTRPWLHVLDAVTGILLYAGQMALHGKRSPAALNLGPGESSTVADIIEIAQRFISFDSVFESKSFREDSRLHLDTTLARSVLSWEAQCKTPEAIELSLQWYKEFYQEGIDLTSFQTKHYLSNLACKLKAPQSA